MGKALRGGDPIEADRYAVVAIVLHWLIAALILLQLVLATRMGGHPTPTTFAVIQLHKSVGVTVLILSLVRLIWRLSHRPPPLPAAMAPWERKAAHATHAALYAVMLGMPLTGWIMVSASRIPVPTLLFGVAPWPMVPGLANLGPSAKAIWREIGEDGHKLIAKGAYLLLTLHVAGALKHQLFSPDERVLGRMAPGAVAGRWREPRLLAIAIAALGIVALARLAPPPRPPQPAPRPAPMETARPVPPAPAVPAPAPVATAPKPSPEPFAPGRPLRWHVAKGSRLSFESAWGGQAVRGEFERWRADILFSPGALDSSRVTVTVDMSSANTGDPQRDAVLPSGDWFDSATHPTAVFTARRFREVADGRFIAEGRLSLKGVSRPLDLPFTLKTERDDAQVRATATLDRTGFGVGQGEFAATDQIPAAVVVRVELKASAAR